MHRRNKPVVGLLCCLILAFVTMMSVAAQSPQPQSTSNPPVFQPTNPLPSDVDGSDPALPVWMRAAAPVPASTPAPKVTGNVPSNLPAQTTQEAQNPLGQVTKTPGGFVVRVMSDEVTLPVTVLDMRHRMVNNLDQRDFTVFEDGQPQQITRFSHEDIPVSIGILVDNSGSMREKRAAVSKAVVNLIKASNPDDEAFIVNFNDDSYLDQDFTNKIPLMQEALDRLDSRGGTALYDSVIASADHLAKGAKHPKKVLLVVTDGEDNESRESLEQAIRSVQNDNGPEIYTIGILGTEGKQRRAKRALEALSAQTGGVAFFPKNLTEVDEISQEIAHDIRNQYNIRYKPSNPQANGGYRTIKVEAHAPGYKELEVRTRSGYFASPQRTASNQPQQ